MTESERAREALRLQARTKAGLRTWTEVCDAVRAVTDGHWLEQWDSTTVIRNDRDNR